MKTKVEICHIDSKRCVVRVSGFDGERDLGSSLGEAADAEQAEDRARARLVEREHTQKAKPPSEQKEPAERPIHQQEKDQARQPNDQQAAENEKPNHLEPLPLDAVPKQVHPPKTYSEPIPEAKSDARSEPSEAPTDPDDWSEELTAIDMQLKRIGWDRSQEQIFLERAYGHGSRHKLTRYSDLVAYLARLTNFEVGVDAHSAAVPLRRSDLISQGDEMLLSLKWSQDQAKQFLQTKHGATSRQQLSDEQLLEFNMMLEEQLISE